MKFFPCMDVEEMEGEHGPVPNTVDSLIIAALFIFFLLTESIKF